MSELCFSIDSTNPLFTTLTSLFPFLLFSKSFLSYPLLLFSFILCFNSVPADFFESDKFSILLSAYYSIVQRIRLQSDHENDYFWCLEDFKFLKMVFLRHPFEFLNCKSAEGSEISILEWTPVEFWDCKSAEGSESSILVETPVEFLDCKSAEGSGSSIFESSCYDNGSSTSICDDDLYLKDKLGENSAEMGSTRGIMKNKKILEDFLKELDVFENLTWGDTVEEKKIEAKAKAKAKVDKAKDWKRTLGCKFYEERHSASDRCGEGMDLLWEKYEMDSMKNYGKRDNKKKKINEPIEQLCCLQALKLSARKMNLGMGRANLVRISKAIKGVKWLHHVIKNNKKVHCGDRF